MKLSIIIPVYNEQNTILEIMAQVSQVQLASGIEKEVIVVDDGSTDGTKEKLKQLQNKRNIRIFFHAKNQGKAFAVNYGLKQSTGDILLIQDADLEYSPESYPLLLAPLLANQAEVVYGSRFTGQIKDMTWINCLANKVTNWTIALLFNVRLTDAMTGFKVFKRNALQHVSLTSRNFGFDSEITAQLLRQGYRIVEVPIPYTARTKSAGKKMTWGKALECYYYLIRSRFTST